MTTIIDLISSHNHETYNLLNALMNRDWDKFKEAKNKIDSIEKELTTYKIRKGEDSE